MDSPWRRALDLSGLDPHLEQYFSAIPLGSEGVGRGTFDMVGTPRRWLWPMLAILARDGVVAPVWQHDVPFEVHNRPMPDGSLAAERRFEFGGGAAGGGTFVMSDRISARGGLLLDRLGRSGRLAAMFGSRVDRGALHLRSIEVRVRVRGSWIRLPRLLTPRVELTERWDAPSERQHVDVSMTLPLIGRIYEYSGFFSYAISHRTESTR